MPRGVVLMGKLVVVVVVTVPHRPTLLPPPSLLLLIPTQTLLTPHPRRLMLVLTWRHAWSSWAGVCLH